MKSSSPQQAIVLAAGLGTRLLPLTQKVPKPILPVGGIPLLFYNLYLLKRAGITDIVVNLHHLPSTIQQLLKPAHRLGLNLKFSLEKKILGTAGGIAQALKKLNRESTFVLNGDILCDLDLNAMWKTHQKNRATATLACVPKHLAKVSSFVESDSQGKIYRIAGKPSVSKASPSLKKSVFTGVHLVEPELFENYPSESFGCVVREIYQPALAAGQTLQAYQHPGSWWDLGSLEELKNVDQKLWQKKVDSRILEFREEVRMWAKPFCSF